MSGASDDLIPIAEAARMLGYKAKKTIQRLGEQGLLDVRMVKGRWKVSKAQVQRARVLTTGRAAKLAGCSKKTIYRRVAAGLITPVRPDKPAHWMSERAVPRFSLDDVAVIRKSVQRKSRTKRRPARASDAKRIPPSHQAELFQDSAGRYWVRVFGRWWRESSPPGV